MSARLTARNLMVAFQSLTGEILPALGAVTFSIEAGEFVCLVGASGSGKSTLIRTFAGLTQPSKGQVFIDDQPVTAPNKRVALMFQEANLMPWRTVIENIALPLEIEGVSKPEREARALEMLPRLGLSEFPRAYPGELSGGMAQRVALGRVLIQSPDVLLLDEPFGALDALTREQISADLMRVWAQERQTVVMVTHDIHEAVMLADRVIVLSRRPGQIVADIPITLPRPRQLSDTYSETFGATAQTIRAAIERG